MPHTESPTQQRLMWEAAKKPEFKLNLGDLIKFGRDADNKTLLMSAMFLQVVCIVRECVQVEIYACMRACVHVCVCVCVCLFV